MGLFRTPWMTNSSNNIPNKIALETHFESSQGLYNLSIKKNWRFHPSFIWSWQFPRMKIRVRFNRTLQETHNNNNKCTFLWTKLVPRD